MVIDDSVGSGRCDLFKTIVDTEIDLNTDTYWDKKSVSATWILNHSYTLNEVVKPTIANNYIYLCTTAGASGETEPIWGTTPGGTTNDNIAVWTCYKDYSIPINRAGVDFYIYACMQSGTVPKILLSSASTFPLGYTANNSRKIGGFHCMPYTTAPTWTAATVMTIAAYGASIVQPTTPYLNKYIYRATARAGDYKTADVTEPTWPIVPGDTVVDDMVTWTCDANCCENLPAGHPYLDFEAGSILFNSIWDLLDRPRSSPEGMAKLSLTPSDGSKAKWVDIYLFNGVGTTCTSVFNATIKDTVDWNTFVSYAALQQKYLLDDDEFQKAANGSNEETNIYGSADPATVTLPIDTAKRSMISNYGLVGMCGIMLQWLKTQSYRFDPDGSVVAATKTLTAYHVAAPEGNPIYCKYMENGDPYLCCNLATITTDVWLTFGTDYKILLKHDASAAVGSVQVYIDEDATQPGRILAALARLKTAYVYSNNGSFALPITYNAAPATPGVALYYDDVTHSRLEFISPTAVNGAIDLALLGGATWTYYNLTGTVGSLYRQGPYGDIKLLAGGGWYTGSYCGSRYRGAYGYRWSADSAIGARAIAEPA
ncbi:MAG: hypothetical protein O8C67_00280 [Candidatus Methanoperedens sp.]|nr:hypothetical protein [Candidatus Methanoperedens sp.]